jgi:hypothetical protein
MYSAILDFLKLNATQPGSKSRSTCPIGYTIISVMSLVLLSRKRTSKTLGAWLVLHLLLTATLMHHFHSGIILLSQLSFFHAITLSLPYFIYLGSFSGFRTSLLLSFYAQSAGSHLKKMVHFVHVASPIWRILFILCHGHTIAALAVTHISMDGVRLLFNPFPDFCS